MNPAALVGAGFGPLGLAAGEVVADALPEGPTPGDAETVGPGEELDVGDEPGLVRATGADGLDPGVDGPEVKAASAAPAPMAMTAAATIRPRPVDRPARGPAVLRVAPGRWSRARRRA